MRIHKNIGAADRIIRIIVLLIALFFGYKISPWFYLLALWELFTIITRWCFVYDILKIDTLKKR
ncbi:DUF2892 domain-containing protein [Candidatus Woesearchaeota archaeon]|nr:DUF2892 domain-containing protein [Candidatus Woesearchaeota archaeon]